MVHNMDDRNRRWVGQEIWRREENGEGRGKGKNRLARKSAGREIW